MSKQPKAAAKPKTKKHSGRAATSAFSMQKLEHLHPALVLSIIFFLSVLVRQLLNLAVSNGPITYIDEGLYINLARGLVWDRALTYRAMPTTYAYLTYPIALMPLMFLPASFNLYRCVQFYNTLLISSAIFPAYLLSRRMGRDRNESYLFVLFISLLPDMALSSFLMSECLLYPLFMWLLYCGWRLICKEKPFLFGSLCAVLTALLYFTKPGYIIFGAVLLAYLLILALRRRKLPDLLRAAGFLALLALLILGAYALYRNTLDSGATLLTHYDKQIPTFSAVNIAVSVQSVCLHLVGFLCSILGLPVLLPLFGRSRLDESQKALLDITLTSVLVSVVGTAIMVSLYEWRGTWLSDRIHLRYQMCFALPLFLLLRSPSLQSLKLSKSQHIGLAVLVLFFLFPGGYSGFTAASGIMDSPSLSLLNTDKLGWSVPIITTLILAACLLHFTQTIKKRGWSTSVLHSFTRALLIFMLLNTCMTYTLRADNKIKGPSDINLEAQALAEMIADEPAVMMTTNLYDDFRTFQSDVHLHRPVQYVVSNNMLLDAVETQGVYRSFVPYTQAPNTYNLPTIDTTLLAFDAAVTQYIEFNESVHIEKTPAGLYSVARIQPGIPWLKTAVSGMFGTTLTSDSTGSLIVYDQDLIHRGSVTLHILMGSLAASDTVTFTAGSQQFTIDVSAQPALYTLELPVTQCAFWDISFSSNHGIFINEYRTE